jgi:hypothetical protein
MAAATVLGVAALIVAWLAFAEHPTAARFRIATLTSLQGL